MAWTDTTHMLITPALPRREPRERENPHGVWCRKGKYLRLHHPMSLRGSKGMFHAEDKLLLAAVDQPLLPSPFLTPPVMTLMWFHQSIQVRFLVSSKTTRKGHSWHASDIYVPLCKADSPRWCASSILLMEKVNECYHNAVSWAHQWQFSCHKSCTPWSYRCGPEQVVGNIFFSVFFFFFYLCFDEHKFLTVEPNQPTKQAKIWRHSRSTAMWSAPQGLLCIAIAAIKALLLLLLAPLLMTSCNKKLERRSKLGLLLYNNHHKWLQNHHRVAELCVSRSLNRTAVSKWQ